MVTKMKKVLMIIIMLCIIAITSSIIYYFVYFRPKIDKAEIRLQEENLQVEKKNAETYFLEYLKMK